MKREMRRDEEHRRRNERRREMNQDKRRLHKMRNNMRSRREETKQFQNKDGRIITNAPDSATVFKYRKRRAQI